jgi:hypothetical protein
MYVTALTGWLAGNLTVFSKNYIKTSPYIPGCYFICSFMEWFFTRHAIVL